MSMNALPSELVSCVVACIESQPTLGNLAQCSRQFYVCVTPQLYHHIRIREEIREEEPHSGQLRKLASSLTRRPDLAGLVRYFTLQAWLRREGDVFDFKNIKSVKMEKLGESEDWASFETARVDQAFRAAVNGSNSAKEEVDNWLRQLSHTHESHHDLILAFLLPALLKVEEVVLDLRYDTPYLERTIARAARRWKPYDIQLPFQTLKVFVYSQNLRSPCFIGSLLQLPAIQEVSFRCYFWDYRLDGDKNLMELGSSTSPLTALYLKSQKPSRAALGHLLRAPKALTTFFCEALSPPSIIFTDILLALGPQENWLENLGFDHDSFFEKLYRSGSHIIGPMPSLISFISLKVFKTAAIFLKATENGTERDKLINIFPPSLETIHLSQLQQASFTDVLEAVEYLLARKSPLQIPSLKRLILEEVHDIFGTSGERLVDILWRDTQETAVERLSRVGAAQGVSIDVIEDVRFNWY